MTQSSGDLLAAMVREARTKRSWTQEQLADQAPVSVDSIRRIERGDYSLPERQRANGHVLDKVSATLGMDICTLIRECFSEEEIRRSAYHGCLELPDRTLGPVAGTGTAGLSLREYITTLPTDQNGLLDQAALLNAHAVAFLIALERQFEAFEFLVSNQPPFVLFADDEYVTTGSASTELAEEDRQTYHAMIFDHRKHSRELVKRGRKHYKVALHKGSLIGFLNARSVQRARQIVEDMKEFLRYDGFDLLIIDAQEAFDEFEVLSSRYPFDSGRVSSSISIRHRRVGVDNTLVYQLALIGSDSTLVLEDHSRAERLWQAGLDQYKEMSKSYKDHEKDRYGLERKRVSARLLEDALAHSHPRS